MAITLATTLAVILLVDRLMSPAPAKLSDAPAR